MRAVLIEDENKAISALKKELETHAPEVEVVDVAKTIIDGVEKIRMHGPDLIFLDIQLSDGLGFEILKQVRDLEFKVIFTTAYSEYAIKAIKYNALDYILKPVDADELKEALLRVKQQDARETSKKREALIQNEMKGGLFKKIALQTTNGIHVHPIASIVRCSADGSYTTIYFDDGKSILVSKALKELEELLVPFNFLRVHHAHLINLDRISSYITKDGGYIILDDGSNVPVSHRKRTSLLKGMDRFNKL